jgi:hypothetical protein
MRRYLFCAAALFSTFFTYATAQPPESFFPHNVGDRWDYQYWNGGFFTYYSTVLTQDSVRSDGSTYLYYDNSAEPKFKIDTLDNVYLYPTVPNSNFLIYKLVADSGEAWFNPSIPEWAWVARVDSGVVFSRRTAIKVFQYGPVHPDSGPQPFVLVERWLASGFGLIYEWQEPGVLSWLRGCIIAGDTFGIVTSAIPLTDEAVPLEYLLKQNYPNPFNPTTTVEFELPEASVVGVHVYNVLGQQVATLQEGKLGSGVHRVLWDAEGLSSGVYLCRLRTNGTVGTIKMLLAK